MITKRREKVELFTKFLNFSRNVIPSIRDIVSDDQFRDGLTRAGGMISLIAVALEAYNSWQKNLQTYEDRAFDALIKNIFATTEGLLNEISRRYLNGDDVNIDGDFNNKKEIVEQLFNSFKEYSYDDSFSDNFPYRHPAVRMFKSLIESKLAEKYKEDEIRLFKGNFEPKLRASIKDNDDIQELIRKITTERTEKKWQQYRNDYLNYIIEKTSIYDNYYVENRQAVLTGTHTWNYKDDDIRKEYDKRIEDAEEIVRDFVEKDPIAKRYLVIAAPFGIGKSYLIKRVSSKYARGYLDGSSDFFPIVVFLKDGLKNVYYDDSLFDVINNIAPPDKDKNSDGVDTKVLLLLDGLEEYPNGSPDSLKNEIISEIKNYPNHKIVLTTRLKAGLPDELGFKEYLRLLSFNEEQINEFFKHYKIDLTYHQAINQIGLNKDEITKPLLAWMLSQIPKINEDLEHLKSDIKLTSNMTKSLIYLYFVHHIIYGQFVDPSKGEDKTKIRCEYLEEKKILRKIALFISLQAQRGTKLTLKDVRENLLSVDLSAIQKILTSYFYAQDRNTNDEEIIIDFVHQTFKEYLLAEYYFECLLNEHKVEEMNIGIPSEATTEFLGGLIELLNTNDDDRVKKFVEYVEENVTLLNSFEYKKGLASAKQQIINNALNYIKAEATPSFSTYEPGRQIGLLQPLDYTSRWINKWISLYVLNILIPKQYSSLINDKRKLGNLLRFTSKEIPDHLKKLKEIDLSNEDLGGAKLSGADMSGSILNYTKFGCTNLSNAKLENAKMTYADLSGADLSGADLSGADLSGADLSGAIILKAKITNEAQLKSTNLSNCKLSGSNLSGADLSNANLWCATLSGANLSNADMTFAQLTRADMSNAIISNANLSNANLSQTLLLEAKLSRCNLSNAMLFYAKLSKADLSNASLYNTYLSYVTAENTNFSNANLDNTYLLQCDLSNSILSNAHISNTVLSGANISNCNFYSSTIKEITKYDDLLCKGADFTKSIIDSKEIAEYLLNNGAVNVTESSKLGHNKLNEMITSR
jgi:uncharacterized protein YjbI with pentapeptide repeats